MRARLVVVSGPVAGGKSALARRLCQRFAGVRFSTRELVEEITGDKGQTRKELQEAGRKLDVETDGEWVAEHLGRRIFETEAPLIVIDAVRVPEQVDALRRAGHRLTHVHITASPEARARRYEERRQRTEVVEAPTYGEVSADPTEARVGELADLADVRIDTDIATVDDVVVRVASHLGLLDHECAPKVDVIVGGSYGSEGKGNIAFYLAPEYDLLVRVGGPNAAHKVYLASGEVFTHFHLPSGTQNGDAQLLIGAGAVIFPDDLYEEISKCDVTASRLSIDPNAMVIETSDQKAEKELRDRIASTASGAGQATARRVLRSKDVRLASNIDVLQPFLRPSSEVLEDTYRAGKRICLEGTQGSGLSLYHGPFPYVTSRDTNVAGCLAEAGIPPARVRKVVLVCRTFPIRVADPPGGTSGPLSRELGWRDVEERAGFERGALAAKELTSKTKTQRRVGEFEWDLLRRSVLLNAPTDIALTFVDYIARDNERAWRFEQLTEDTIRFIEEVERVAGAPVSLISHGFFPHRGLIDRRHW